MYKLYLRRDGIYEGHPKIPYTDHEGDVRFLPFLAHSRIIFTDEWKSTRKVGPAPCAPVVQRWFRSPSPFWQLWNE